MRSQAAATVSGVTLAPGAVEQHQLGAAGEEAGSAGLVDLDMRIAVAEDARDTAGTAPPARGNWPRCRSSPRRRGPRSRTARRRRRRAAGSTRRRHRPCRAGSTRRSPRSPSGARRAALSEKKRIAPPNGDGGGRRQSGRSVGSGLVPRACALRRLRFSRSAAASALPAPCLWRSSPPHGARASARQVGLTRAGAAAIGPPFRTKCCRSSVVERILGKAEVVSSILTGSTIFNSPGCERPPSGVAVAHLLFRRARCRSRRRSRRRSR